MLKLLVALLLSICMSGVCATYLLLNRSWDTTAAEATRQSRITLQSAQQNLSLLKHADSQKQLNVLSKDQDSLKVDLALNMSELSVRNASMSLSFEQQLMQQVFSALDDTLQINVVSLQVKFRVSHALNAMDTLQEIGGFVGSWPYEVRACELERLEVAGLSVSCVLHIYHWPIANTVVNS